MGSVISFEKYLNATAIKKQRDLDIRANGGYIKRQFTKFKKENRKLEKAERIILARALDKELTKLKRKPGFNLGKFAIEAKLSEDPTSRNLHKLTLSMTASDARQHALAAYTNSYCKLIEAIHKEIGGSLDELFDRVTRGTSLHKSKTNDSETFTLFYALEKTISNISNGFREISGGLTVLEVFQETAKMKVRLRKDDKSLFRWPYYDADIPYDQENPADYEHGYSGPEGYAPPRLEDEIDVKYAYWRRNVDFDLEYSFQEYGGHVHASDLAHYDAIINLPRIYLGLAMDWSEQSNFECQAQQRDWAIKAIDELGERRDPDSGQAEIVWRNPATGKHDVSTHDSTGTNETDHCWLIIYPSPDDNESLCAVIYRPYEEGGTHLIPLNLVTFPELQKHKFITREGQVISLYDRIKQLMGYGNDKVAVDEEWAKTAPDLLKNPIRMEYDRKRKLDESFETHLNKFLRGDKT